MILALDPGTTLTAWLYLDPSPRGGHVVRFGISPNEHVVNTLIIKRGTVDLVIEMIASYGMPVGETTFETVVWIGRFIQAYADPARTYRLKRIQIKSYLCHSGRAKDGNVRQALIDRFGGDSAIGKRASPGPLYGVTADVWAALAVAVTHHDRPDLSYRGARLPAREAAHA